MHNKEDIRIAVAIILLIIINVLIIFIIKGEKANENVAKNIEANIYTIEKKI